MKFVFLAVVAIVLFSALAQSVSVPARNIVCTKRSMTGQPKATPEVVQFIEGFFLGVESDIGDVALCLHDVDVTLLDFEHAVADLEFGFKNKSFTAIQRAFQEIGDGLNEITVAVKDCNVTQIVKEIEQLATDLKSGTAGIIKIILKEAINIFAHRKDVTQDVKSFIEQWKAKNYNLAGFQMGKLVGILLNYETSRLNRRN